MCEFPHRTSTIVNSLHPMPSATIDLTLGPNYWCDANDLQQRPFRQSLDSYHSSWSTLFFISCPMLYGGALAVSHTMFITVLLTMLRNCANVRVGRRVTPLADQSYQLEVCKYQVYHTC